jgi:hypothetical protein
MRVLYFVFPVETTNISSRTIRRRFFAGADAPSTASRRIENFLAANFN